MGREYYRNINESDMGTRAAFHNVRHVASFLSNSPKNFQDFVARIELTR